MRNFRKQSGLTQKQFVEIVNNNPFGYNITRQTLSNYELGKSVKDRTKTAIEYAKKRVLSERLQITTEALHTDLYAKINEMTREVKRQKGFFARLTSWLKRHLVHSWRDGEEE